MRHAAATAANGVPARLPRERPAAADEVIFAAYLEFRRHGFESLLMKIVECGSDLICDSRIGIAVVVCLVCVHECQHFAVLCAVTVIRPSP